ncbi:phage shock protein A, PspA [Magnetococcus marinus MC-1]|uniref:Phage shock protein A, PspA n=1 Tax=Magnetococcus marinus (strain ATCC BAA-1437 / JCM 17883 / MC-1) TaxID=156889 RepID=A0LCH2_MAGMM|nr:PspA/IM30 family protein [Magnetococcus marinus]ABK45665.1 phage shock protein A, PspA [Magnetococcus marinus MC-1]
MSGLFQRLFTWGKSEAHSAMDKLEDPAKMAEQGIRDLQAEHAKNMDALAKVKAQVIRLRREMLTLQETASNYERKAMLLVQKGQQGALDGAEADRLASEALSRYEDAQTQANRLKADLENMEKMAAQLERNVQQIKSQIGKWENELRTLKARAQVSSATRKLNAQLASVDGKGTIAMLERMRDKVQEQESLAEAYGEMAAVPKTVDDEIDKALMGGGGTQTDALAALKARMAAKD